MNLQRNGTAPTPKKTQTSLKCATAADKGLRYFFKSLQQEVACWQEIEVKTWVYIWNDLKPKQE